MADLSPRKEQILRAIVLEYVSGAEPVPSDVIAQKYEIGVRSATVRSEMAEITDLGYLEQPHTSAGRIPSDLGYRYFVDHLMAVPEVSTEDRTKLKSVKADDETLREILTESTRVLSRVTHLFAAAATVKDAAVPIRHVVITGLGPDKILLVMVLQNGVVENRILEAKVEVSLDLIGKANAALESSLQGKNLGHLVKYKVNPTGDAPLDSLLTTASHTLRSIAKELTKGHFFMDGEEYILAQPEFSRNPELLENLLSCIEDEESLRAAIVEPNQLGQPVTIGKENQSSDLHRISINRRIFFVGESEAGAIAIIGPTRMDYGRGASILDFTAQAISETLTKIFR